MKAIASVIGCGLTLQAAWVVAQETIQSEASSIERSRPTVEKREIDRIEEIVVTGSHIRGAKGAGSPLLVLTREDIDRSGADSTSQLMRSLPQNFGGGQNEFNNDSATGNSLANGNNLSGASSINLRGLGSESTLVLLNGNRLAPSGVQDSVDISAIPLNAIERVEIIPDGASAVYGADAVGGVVNFVLKTDYSGAESKVEWGSTSRGGEQLLLAQSLGSAWATGQTVISLEYADREPINSNERRYSNTIAPPMTLVPGNERKSLLLALSQSFADRYELSLQGLGTRRDISSFTTFPGLSAVANTSSVQQYSAATSVSANWTDEWRTRITLTSAKDAIDHVTRVLFLAGAESLNSQAYSSRISEVIASTEGALFRVPGGRVRAAVGGGLRQEHAEINLSAPTRRAQYVYAEGQAPLLAPSNGSRLGRELVLSVGGRHETYSDFGSAFSPKLGLLYSPSADLTVRGTWGRAFRAPKPFALYSPNTAILLNVPAGVSPDAPFVGLFRFGGNAELGPEESQSYTAGIDVAPESMAGLRISSTYYHIDYRNRILTPTGSIFSSFTDPAFTSLLFANPTAEHVESVLAESEFVQDLTGGATPDSVAYVVDWRYQNISALSTKGLDMQLRWTHQVGSGALDWSINATKILEFTTRALPGSVVESRLDRIFHTPSLRVRGGVTLSAAEWDVSAFINYVDGYLNDAVTPSESVHSWATVDGQIARGFTNSKSQLLANLRLALSVSNLLNADPPYARLTVPIGYDTTNADPRGRFVALALQKKW